MMQDNIKLDIPFNSLLESIKKLNLKEKIEILKVINAELEQTEDHLLEQDPQLRLEIKEAKEAYNAGDYITIDEFIKKQKK
ncbi:MAG: hypothetical protein WCE54_18640 [Ignavibacteriaceae bacterium]